MVHWIENIVGRPRKRQKKINVFALVGSTGTGKSFRARLVMEKYGIDLLIDDGLLIRDLLIIAGRSAKREKNKVTAIKRDIMEEPADAEEIRAALKKEKVKSILIIGTSEKMVARIAERTGLDYPEQVIYIEDVATQDEIRMASETRRIAGKHIIPVPMVEVKQDPSHRILDSIKIFIKNYPVLFWKKQIVEKTVVQPPFSRRGRLSISETALSQMIMHCINEYTQDVQINRIIIEHSVNGYCIEVRLAFPFEKSIPQSFSGLQEYIVYNIERYSGIVIEEMNLTVDQITKKRE